jgi:predicted transcriptional regulator
MTPPPAGTTARPAWTFLTNHAHVLLCIARAPEILMRDVAGEVGITERAVQKIVSELEESGYLQRKREGRRNRYQVRGDLPLRHPIERHRLVFDLLALVMTEPESGGSA